MADRISNGRPIRMLTIVDEFTAKCVREWLVVLV